MLKHAFAAAAAILAITLPAFAKPPLEAFGDLPDIRAVDISPDGGKLAFIQRKDGADILVVHDLATHTSKGLASITEFRTRGLGFVGENYVVLRTSTTDKILGIYDKYENSSAFAFNLTTGKHAKLLAGTEGLFFAQSGLGQIVSEDPSGKYVYMPAFMGTTSNDLSYDVLKVNLETGRGARGGGFDGASTTQGWLFDSKGKPIAREDFSETNHTHEFRVYQSGGWRKIFSEQVDMPIRSIYGISADGKSLMITDRSESGLSQLYEMNIADGKLSPPIHARENAEIAGVIRNKDRVVIGVMYSGLFPKYEMFDPALNADILSAQKALPSSSVSLASWSDDWSKILFYAEGGTSAERYLLFDRATKKLTTVATGRPAISGEDIGEVDVIEYAARDGLKISAIVTWPIGVKKEDRRNLPMVVLPHGGPESYDSVGFHWLAQFIANEGYLVLQPNFRGSGGFGQKFAEAGYHQWGRKMQDDVTDGADALVKMGWADSSRMCIVGWSYGGYSALAGGALTPDKYRCVVAVAGVSNLRDMLRWEMDRHGGQSETVTYWESVIGDLDKDREAIDAVSPSRLADKFKAPVLLIHGNDDTTVPIAQSNTMKEALTAAGKPVAMIKIKGDDHGLVDSDSRKTALTAISDFLAKNIGKPN